MPRKKETYNAYMNDYMKRRYAKRRQQAITVLGGACVTCGSVEELEFDHVDPHTKEVTMAKASSFSEVRWQAELVKCQLLCHFCHVEKHRSDSPCGTPQRYWTGCRCIACRQANTAYNREYRQPTPL